jgi:hypothetical protein
MANTILGRCTQIWYIVHIYLIQSVYFDFQGGTHLVSESQWCIGGYTRVYDVYPSRYFHTLRIPNEKSIDTQLYARI